MAGTILLAENSGSVRKFVILALKLKDYNVIAVPDGAGAMQKLAESEIDLVITGLTLQDMDGLSLIKEIRDNKDYNNLPVIILSSIERDEGINKGLEAGANSYLIKPFNTKRIQYEVAKYLV